MAYRRLSLLAPVSWLESLPARKWDVRSKTWIFPPNRIPAIAAGYRAYVMGELDSHALRRLNADWWPDSDAHATLALDTVSHAVAAAARAGVAFSPGRSTDRQVVAGLLSLDWLESISPDVADFALEHWDPDVAQRRRDSAAKGGRTSKRPGVYSAADLPAGSITAQAEALGCSRRTIARLRRELKQSVSADS